FPSPVGLESLRRCPYLYHIESVPDASHRLSAINAARRQWRRPLTATIHRRHFSDDLRQATKSLARAETAPSSDSRCTPEARPQGGVLRRKDPILEMASSQRSGEAPSRSQALAVFQSDTGMRSHTWGGARSHTAQ